MGGSVGGHRSHPFPNARRSAQCGYKLSPSRYSCCAGRPPSCLSTHSRLAARGSSLPVQRPQQMHCSLHRVVHWTQGRGRGVGTLSRRLCCRVGQGGGFFRTRRGAGGLGAGTRHPADTHLQATRPSPFAHTDRVPASTLLPLPPLVKGGGSGMAHCRPPFPLTKQCGIQGGEIRFHIIPQHHVQDRQRHARLVSFLTRLDRHDVPQSHVR